MIWAKSNNLGPKWANEKKLAEVEPHQLPKKACLTHVLAHVIMVGLKCSQIKVVGRGWT